MLTVLSASTTIAWIAEIRAYPPFASSLNSASLSSTMGVMEASRGLNHPRTDLNLIGPKNDSVQDQMSMSNTSSDAHTHPTLCGGTGRYVLTATQTRWEPKQLQSNEMFDSARSRVNHNIEVSFFPRDVDTNISRVPSKCQIGNAFANSKVMNCQKT